jgi:hypothetical protein
MQGTKVIGGLDLVTPMFKLVNLFKAVRCNGTVEIAT